MHFTGISTTLLLQAGGILAGVLVVFYILKLRRRPVAVPFAPLWEKILRDKEATSLFSQLKRLLSLLLQMALVALMLLALGDPRPTVQAEDARHVVVLFDGSASMKAIDVEQQVPKKKPQAPSGLPFPTLIIPPAASSAPPAIDPGEELAKTDKIDRAKGKRTRLQAGKDRIGEAIRGLSGSDRMLIAQMDGAVTPLSTMTGEIPELEAALEKVAATDVRAQYARGLRFAVDALRDLSKPEIIIVSDGALGEPIDTAGPVELGDIKLTYLPVGRSARNVAISGFSVRRYPLDKSRYEVLLEVTNTADEAHDVDLELYGDGKLTDIVSLKLQPKEKVSRFYPNLSGADKTLEAKIAIKGGAGDDLPVDDHAYALLPERRRARIQVVTRGNMYLEAALLLDEYLDVTMVDPKTYPSGESFDVTIFDDVSPVVAEGSGHVLYLNPQGDDLPFKVGKKVKSDPRYTLGFDEIETKHPIVRHLVLGDINIAEGFPLEGTKEDNVVGRSFKGPLLIAGRRKGFKFVALGFDIRQSDLPLRISWPLLLLNVINEFLEEDTSYISSFRTGQVWSIPAAADATEAVVELPTGDRRTVPIKDGRAVYLGQHAGFYKLTVGEEDEAETSMFAANLSDPVESAIAPADKLSVGEREAGQIGGFEIGVRRELWIYLLAAVLLVTALEWLSYHRRVTV